jgi:uroporphyrinogen III methyltransferase/synthase
MTKQQVSQTGTVYLVGAGPGAADLVTLRAVGILQRADVVLYDYLANPQLLEHAPPQAEAVCLGRHGQGRIWSQEEINARLVELARAGKTVVRLKGGDPAIFARTAEEVKALTAAGIPFEIVPGVTAALAAGSYAGIPVTHRELASAVALVTGHEEHDKDEAAVDWAALAVFPGTLVVYMGVTTAQHWTAALIAAGKPRDTPAAIVRHCSRPDQHTIRCRLDEVAEHLTGAKKIRPPVITIIGPVTQLEPTWNWFQRRPLFGQSVVVTRPAHQAGELRDALSDLGAEVLVQPAIQIAPPADWSAVDAALARLRDFNWLVFSSSNGVRFFLDRLLSSGRDARALGKLRIAAMGPGTAAELAKYRLLADVQPDEFRAEALAEKLSANARGQKFLLARASRGREVLSEELAAAGGSVEQVVVYRSHDVTCADLEIAARLAAGEIDWVTVTSSAIARSLHALFGQSLSQAKLASISPVTTATLGELGHAPAVEAREYTMAGLVAAIVAARV